MPRRIYAMRDEIEINLQTKGTADYPTINRTFTFKPEEIRYTEHNGILRIKGFQRIEVDGDKLIANIEIPSSFLVKMKKEFMEAIEVAEKVEAQPLCDGCNSHREELPFEYKELRLCYSCHSYRSIGDLDAIIKRKQKAADEASDEVLT